MNLAGFRYNVPDGAKYVCKSQAAAGVLLARFCGTYTV